MNNVMKYTVATIPDMPAFPARRNIVSTMAPVQSSCGEILVTASQLERSRGTPVPIIPPRPLVSAETWPNVRI